MNNIEIRLTTRINELRNEIQELYDLYEEFKDKRKWSDMMLQKRIVLNELKRIQKP